MELGILGGTGNAGRALAARLAHTGHLILLGSRSVEKAEAAVDKIQVLNQKLSDGGFPEKSITPVDNLKAAQAEVVIVATPADAAASTVANLSSELKYKLVISMCNALYRSEGGEFLPEMKEPGTNQSIAEAIQYALPESQVVSAFHHLPAKTLGDLSQPINNDVVICSDHPDAAAQVSEIIKGIKNLRPLNAGGLNNSLAIEAFTAILLNLSLAEGGPASIKITGI